VAAKLKKPLISLIVLFVATVALDQGAKQWAYRSLLADEFHDKEAELPVCGTPEEERARERYVRRHRESVTVIDGFFNMHYVENCASAFGLMGKVPESFRFPFFLIVSILAAAFIPYLYRKTPANQKLMLYALPFVLGGAIGNLVDRLVYRYVIDFIQWYVTVDGVPRYWPTFNVADAAIVVGIGLMVLQMLPSRKKTRARAGSASSK
jgi:signal peptidase II